MEQLTNNLVDWLRKQVKESHTKGLVARLIKYVTTAESIPPLKPTTNPLESHTKGLVVGLSGGIDSAVVTYLIKRAFPEDSLAVVMPIKSNPNDIKDANKIIEDSGIKNYTIDLTQTHEILYNEIHKQINANHEWQANKSQINDANLRARLRMSTLYSVATNYQYLVVGTDNLAEWYTGYFTKYDDGGSDIL